MSNQATIPQMSVSEAQAAIAAGKVQVVDVRPSFDFAGGRIPNSTSLPHRALATRPEELDGDKLILFVSEDGEQAKEAARLAQSLGFSDIATISGGFDAWLDADYPIHTIDDSV